jgi:DNA-binding response OmpR family regulator
MLTNWGYDVVLAGDGDEAWKILQQPDAPQLAILDWVMPGMDGIDVCRRVRSKRFGGPIYILILTAKTDSEDLRLALEAGADDYATKPFKSQELRARLRTARRILQLEEQLAAAVQGLGRTADKAMLRPSRSPIPIHQ